MSLRRRILRITLTVLVVLVFAGYFAFSTLFFNPLEDDYAFPLASLVPRDVDFFAAKRDLADDFGTFPELAILDTLENSETGRLLLESPEVRQRLAHHGVDSAIADLGEQLAALPIEVDPLKIFGGSEVLVAGYFSGAVVADADYVALGRSNWMGKLGVSLLDWPSVLGLEGQGVTVSEEEGVYTLNSVDMLRPLHVARIADVVVMGTSLELVAGAIDLEARKGQDSFGQSARYGDYIAGVDERELQDVEVFVDYRTMSDKLGLDTAIPDPNADTFTPAFIARLVQMRLIKELEGVVGFTGGLSLDLHADLNSELLSSEQTRFYRAQGANQKRMFEVAELAPADVALLAYLQVDVSDLMGMALDSMEDAAQQNFDDAVRQVWQYPEGQMLIDELGTALRDRVALVVRTNDYPDEGLNGPPNDGDRVFTWAAIGWHKDTGILEDFRSKIINNQGSFGIRGRESGSQGVFRNTLSEGGITVYEFWSPLVPGTGHMAMVISNEVFIISNHNSLIADIILTDYDDPDHPSLAEEPMFATQIGLGLNSASAMVWMRPDEIREDLRAMADQLAFDQVVIDWDTVHRDLSTKLLAETFGGRPEDQLAPDEFLQYEGELESRKQTYEDNLITQHVPELSARYNRYVDYLLAVRGMLLQLSLNPKSLDLALRTLIPLEAPL